MGVSFGALYMYSKSTLRSMPGRFRDSPVLCNAEPFEPVDQRFVATEQVLDAVRGAGAWAPFRSVPSYFPAFAGERFWRSSAFLFHIFLVPFLLARHFSRRNEGVSRRGICSVDPGLGGVRRGLIAPCAPPFGPTMEWHVSTTKAGLRTLSTLSGETGQFSGIAFGFPRLRDGRERKGQSAKSCRRKSAVRAQAAR